ncbi:tRNA pseudouridine synthase A-like protein [Novymonas esmeraldas]|uniref:tRNA pseudouridine synthase A-like protein n=1 Tax=Novymonas esmeraldas TaxID=1808958 RepID=A0AAW0EV66_9TRYP
MPSCPPPAQLRRVLCCGAPWRRHHRGLAAAVAAATTTAATAAGPLVSAVHLSHRHCSSSSSSGSSGAGAGAGAGAGGTMFPGWRRLDTSATTHVSPPPPPPPPPAVATLDVSATDEAAEAAVLRKRSGDDARRQAAHARLSDMFTDSAQHSQWMQEQRQQTRVSPGYEDESAPARLVRSPSSAATAFNTRTFTFDEDAEGSDDSAAATRPLPAATALVGVGAGDDVLEHELLDDNFLYFPPVEARGEVAAAESARYVPGQQVVPPGLTRYRLEVQYQGSDFDGWYKSVQRTTTTTTTTTSTSTSSAAVADYGAGSRHFAKVVLEEALAVALDVAAVSVVAAAIPETGVSVRRLTCHVDVPSDVELQPRTILQRATLWLHQRRQPLAVLSCHPCRHQNFHARHSGVRRVYCYRILNRIAPPLFDAGMQWHVDRYLDVPRMQRMARLMEGTHDFGFFADPKMANALRRAAASSPSTRGGPVVSSAYSAEHEPLTSHGLTRGATPAAPKVAVERGLTELERAAALPTFNEYGQRVITYQAKPQEYHRARTNLPTVRTLDRLHVVRQEDEVLLWFVGQSFLRHQIRNMVSVLKAGGHGLWDEQELHHAFQTGFEVSRKKFKRERLAAAPVHGLTLWDVEYPSQHKSDSVDYVDAGPYEPVDVSVQH